MSLKFKWIILFLTVVCIAAIKVSIDSQNKTSSVDSTDPLHHNSHRSLLLEEKVLILSAKEQKRCTRINGEHVINLLYKNKVDYTRLHGIDFYIATKEVDQRLSGIYSKLAVILKVLEETRYDWVVWMDQDTMFTGPDFRFKFENYKGFDFISWGNWDAVKKGDVIAAISKGVYLMRNTRWTRNFIREVSQYGIKPELEEDMKKNLYQYERHNGEANAIVRTLQKNTTSMNYEKKIFFEGSYVLSGFWAHYPLERLKKVDIVKHYAGCGFCHFEGDGCMNDVKITADFATQRFDALFYNH